ncbi:MAG: UDP-N-acetylmuramoyl-tripeptide--D-alanyl-D-alanine ligase [Candidatus Marinimicrobia bacterium]|nr:UDP-N-acetylmuramoyl-tripeptide--D-alanyl-D-alanine ligase [Candidatus Neomarinimicrobiota bacterium]
MRISLPQPELFAEVFQAVTGQHLDNKVTGIATDNRHVLPGDMFIALKGEQVDGHTFVSQAVEAGATTLMVENRSQEFESAQSIIVGNAIITIGEIAQKWRQRFSIPVIGITGTNGKTTTKELLRHVLSSSYNVHATEGNFNTSIGLPLCLLTLTDTHTASILEMGANQSGDISYLCDIAQPTHGLITNIAPAHLEGFGSIDAIAQEKGELFLSLSDGISFVNDSDSRIVDLPIVGEEIHFGFTPICDFAADLIVEDDQSVTVNINTVDVLTYSRNKTLAKNILAVASIAVTLGVDWEVIQSQIASYTPTNGRCVVKQIGDITIIDDTYNANVTSTKESIDFLSSFDNGKQIFIFGDMLELGDDSSDLHSQIGNYCTQKQLDVVLTAGKWTTYTHEAVNNRIIKFHSDTKEGLIPTMSDIVKPGDIVLFKGSRGMAMETLIAELESK